MSTVNPKQLCAVYDQNENLGLEQIAVAFDLDVEQVKLLLLTGGSVRFQREGEQLMGPKKFRRSQLSRAYEVIAGELGNDDANIRLQAAKLMVQIDSGAFTPARAVAVTQNFIQNNFNVNERFERALAARESARKAARAVIPQRSTHDDVPDRRGLHGGEISSTPVASEGIGELGGEKLDGDFLPA